MIKYFRKYVNLPPDDELYSKIVKTPSRGDIPSVVVKQLLQQVLPQNIRNAVVSELFKRIVTKSEVIFAKKCICH